MTAGMVDFYKHNLWANLRLLDVCASLSAEQLEASAPGTYGRIGDTLVHLLRSEAGYLARCQGQEPVFPRSLVEFLDIETLREHARKSGEGLIAVAGTMLPTQVVRGTYRGKPYEMPMIVPLIQAIVHAADHRSQVSTVLTHLGIEPPDLSAWAYDTETRG
jgi:uncharacterized damage-inducible protein DinB